MQYIEEMNEVVNSIDLTDQNPSDDRKLRKLHSPLAFFVLKEDGNLAVVAIQSDAEPGMRIFFCLILINCYFLKLRKEMKLN